MSFGWLANLLGALLGRLSPLKSIQHWKIWAELDSWYKRFKKWRDWYRDHVLTPMKRMQQLQRQLYDTFFKPLLLFIDHIRLLTQIVGLFSHKLANKLNLYFLRIEGYLLKPFNTATGRINALSGAIQGVLTALGYLDRDTLLNSIWRDAALVKQILHNPFNQHPPAGKLSTTPSIEDHVQWTKQYLASDSGPYAADVDAGVQLFKNLQAGG